MSTVVEPYESVWTHLSRVSFKHGWVNVNGLATRYIEAGPIDSPALFFLHGTAGSLESFCATIGEHAKWFRCVAFDLIGSGFTDKPPYDYEIHHYVEHTIGLMHALGIKRASFLGVSLGSWVIARLAIDHPEIVERLIMNAPFGLSDDADEISGISSRRGKAFGDPSWENISNIFKNLIHIPTKRIPDIIGMRQLMYQSKEARDAAGHILNIFHPEALQRNLIKAEDWRKIQAPTLITLSKADRPMFIRTALTLSELIPFSQLLEMDGVGHWPHFEKPEEFNRSSLAFLKKSQL